MVYRPNEDALNEGDLELLQVLRRASDARAAQTEVAARFVEWLAHENAIIVARSAQVLATFGESGLSALVAALEDPQRRVAAIGVLGQVRDKTVSASISVYAEDPDANVCRAVMEALGRIRDPAAVRALLNGANDPVYDVRDAACAALDSVGTAAVIVAFTSIVAPALDRIADTTELSRTVSDGRNGFPREIPRHAGEAPVASESASSDSRVGASGIRQLFDSIVSSRTSARDRRRSSRP
jgi:hypothetical protein